MDLLSRKYYEFDDVNCEKRHEFDNTKNTTYEAEAEISIAKVAFHNITISSN